MPNKKNGSIQDQELFTIFIETLTGTTFEIKVSPQDRVRSIKSKIQRVEGIPISHQHLLYNLKELKDSSCVTDPSVALHDQATVKLVLSMRGGPISLVHQTVPLTRSLIKLNRREDLLDELSSGSKMAVLVLRVGDQLNLLHVVEDYDGPESRDSWSSEKDNTSIDSMLEGATCKSLEENNKTMEKVSDLKEKMEKLALQRKSNKTESKRVSERETNSNMTSKKPNSSLRLPSLQCDSKKEMFKSRSEFSQIPILPDIIAQCGNSPSRKPDFIDVNEETEAFGVCDSVRPKTCPGSLCDNEFNVFDDVQCEKTSVGIQQPHFRSCVSACTTKVHHEWSGRKSLLQSLNIPHPSTSVADVFDGHHKVSTSVPPVENVNMDNRILRSSYKSRQSLKKEDINVKKKEIRTKKDISFSNESISYPETKFTLWNSNPLYSPFNSSSAFGVSSSSSFCGLLENSSNSDLAGSLIKDKSYLNKKQRFRCSECKKKLSLTTTFECRCGLNFCSLHRYSETHNCSYDFKKDSRKILEQANPSVVAPKLPKI